jgi:hypothetical protein
MNFLVKIYKKIIIIINMTRYSSNKINILNLNILLQKVSNNLFNDEWIINNIYSLDKSVHHKNRFHIKKLIQHYFLKELVNIISMQIIGHKTIVLVQPTPSEDISFLEDSTGLEAIKIIKKLIKKIQPLIPLYFCFLDKTWIFIKDVKTIEDLESQKDLYYLLLEITNKDKKYNIKKFKEFLLKNGFTLILKSLTDPNNLVTIK